MLQRLPTDDLKHVCTHAEKSFNQLSSARIFVTGATGFFGKWWVDSFLYAIEKLGLKTELILLVRNQQIFEENFPTWACNKNIKTVEGDVRDFVFPEGKLTDIIHFATPANEELNQKDPALMKEIIVEGAKRVIQLAKASGNPRILFTSSGAVYNLDTTSAYANGKKEAETLFQKAVAEGLEVKIARCFAFIGPCLPLDAHYAIGNFIKDGLKRYPIQVNGDGTPVRSYLYGSDLVIWLLTILTEGKSGNTYDVGSEEEISIAKLAGYLASRLRVSFHIAETPATQKPVNRYIPNSAATQKELGLKVHIDLKNAIEKTLSWHAPKASIFIMGYNQGHYLREAIDSALNQTYSNIEIVVLDNGSKDHSPQIMREYGEKYPQLTLIYNSKNEWPTHATSQGVKACTGEFVSILYADDYYLPQKIEKQMHCFQKLDSSYGVVYCSGYRENVNTAERWTQSKFNASGKILSQMFKRYGTDGCIMPIAPLIRKACFEKYPFHKELFAEGDDIFFRFALSYKFQYLDEPLVVMRDHENNMGKTIKLNSKNNLEALMKLEQEPEISRREKRQLRHYLSSVYRNYTWQGFRVLEDKAWVKTSLKNSLRWQPTQIFHGKILASLLLLALPQSLWAPLNQFFYRLSNRKEVISWKESYQ